MDRPSLNEQIDACRPGHNDPDDAQLREELAPLAEQLAGDAATRQRYERSREFDAAVAAAVHDVPVPEGLAERLLAALPDTPAAATAADEVPVPPAALDPLQTLGEDAPPAVAPTPASPPVRWWWRRSVLATAAVAASLLLGLGIYYWLQPTPITLAQVQQEIEDEYVADVVQANGWQDPATKQPRFPFPKRTVRANNRLHRWRKATVWGCEADVHALIGPNRPGQATLFVIRRSVTGLADSPFKAKPITGAKLGNRFGCLIAWQDKQYVYVLAVEGDMQDLGAFLRRGGPLARHEAPRRLAAL